MLFSPNSHQSPRDGCALFRPRLALTTGARNSLYLTTMDTSHEIEVLTKAIREHGSKNDDGKFSIAYGVLFKKTEDTLEALNGTLRSAKRKKQITFDGELLMMPRDKDVQVVLLE